LVLSVGNAGIVKPSEISVATSNLLSELIPQYLDNECYAVVTGGVEVAEALVREKFDYIFYTGSSNIGKIVMRRAAEHLTPVTLELGGKRYCKCTVELMKIQIYGGIHMQEVLN